MQQQQQQTIPHVQQQQQQQEETIPHVQQQQCGQWCAPLGRVCLRQLEDEIGCGIGDIIEDFCGELNLVVGDLVKKDRLVCGLKGLPLREMAAWGWGWCPEAGGGKCVAVG